MGIANTFAMIRLLERFLADESAVPTIEYALVAGGIALAIVTVLIASRTLNHWFVVLSTMFG